MSKKEIISELFELQFKQLLLEVKVKQYKKFKHSQKESKEYLKYIKYQEALNENTTRFKEFMDNNLNYLKNLGNTN